MLLKQFSVLLAAPTLLMGCGGSGGSSTPDSPTAASHYVFDPNYPLVPSGSTPSGYSSTGSWMPIRIDTSDQTPGGYFIDGALIPFPKSAFPATAKGGSVEAAGGHYVWATYAYPSGAFGTAILDRNTSQAVDVDGTYLSNEGIASPDGTSAFVALTDGAGHPTGSYALLSAAGALTPLPIQNAPGYVVEGHANTGWTVAMSSPNAAIARTSALSQSVALQHTSRDANQGAMVISPQGTVTALQGTAPQVWCVNSSGTSGGFDLIGGVEVPVMWDTTGRETVLKSLAPDGDGTVFGIADNGLMVGSSGGNTAALWQPNGAVVNLTSRIEFSGSEAFPSGAEIQSSGKILGFGADGSGNSAIVALVPTTK